MQACTVFFISSKGIQIGIIASYWIRSLYSLFKSTSSSKTIHDRYQHGLAEVLPFVHFSPVFHGTVPGGGG